MQDDPTGREPSAYADDCLPVRREVMAPPRRPAITSSGRRRGFTFVVLGWVVVVITVPLIALRGPPDRREDSATTGGSQSEQFGGGFTGPFTQSPPARPDPTTTLPDPVAYARLGLPIPDLSVPPPEVRPLGATPGVDAPWESPPPTQASPATSSTIQVLTQVVGVEVSRTDQTKSGPAASESAEVADKTVNRSSGGEGPLARTGLEPWVLLLLVLGAVLILLGAVLVLLARRRGRFSEDMKFSSEQDVRA